MRALCLRPLIAAPLLGAGIAAPAAMQPAQTPTIAALTAIEPGQYQLRPLGEDGPGRSLCISDRAVLIQLKHPGAACSRFVIDNQPGSATVHYSCPGAGHGRTTIRVETGRLFQLHSQGVADNAPFEMAYEGRRIGSCVNSAAR